MSMSAQYSPMDSHLTQSKSQSPHKARQPCIAQLSTISLISSSPSPSSLSSFYMNPLAVPRTRQYTVPLGSLHLLFSLPTRVFPQISMWLTLSLPSCQPDHTHPTPHPHSTRHSPSSSPHLIFSHHIILHIYLFTYYLPN